MWPRDILFSDFVIVAKRFIPIFMQDYSAIRKAKTKLIVFYNPLWNAPKISVSFLDMYVECI